MPAYHSALGPASVDAPTVAGVPLLPLKGGARGPAPAAADGAGDDIIDDALALFRANVLFRSFDIQAPADLLLAYLTLFIQQALRRLDAARPATPAEATALLRTLATTDGAQPVPGAPGWPLDGIFPAPAKGDETGEWERVGGRLAGCCDQAVCVHARDLTHSPASAPSRAPACLAAEAVRTYLRQLRETAVARMVPAVYANTEPGAGPSKHWLMFAKRRFMNRELP